MVLIQSLKRLTAFSHVLESVINQESGLFGGHGGMDEGMVKQCLWPSLTRMTT